MDQRKLSNIILTGELKTGKSTFLENVLQKLKLNYSYFKTNALLIDEKVCGFQFSSSIDNTKHQFAELLYPNKIGPEKYCINSQIFNTMGVEIFSKLMAKNNLVVIDELGIFEFNSDMFLRQIFKLFKSTIPVVAIVQKRALLYYTNKLQKQNYLLFDLDFNNKNNVAIKLIQHIEEMSKSVSNRPTISHSKKEKY